MNFIKKYYPDYTDEKMEIIKYGIASLYLTISKSIVIFAIALMLGILMELIIFSVIYNIIRMPSFGMHATKSWICLVSTTLIFIGSTYLCTLLVLPIWIKIILGIIGTIFIFKNSPADTEKKPIVSPKRRAMYKTISTSIAVLYVVMAIIIPDTFIVNCLIFSLIIQCFIISPAMYKLFGLPYDNYKTYLANHN